MKLALFAALVTLSAAQYYSPSATSVIFKPGVEYVYHYKGHVLNGIPKASTQFAGLLIDTLVVLQFQQDYKVVMKLEKIKLYKVNNKISTPPLETLNENELSLLTGEQAVVITEQLVKPMKFRYVEGEVRELEEEAHDRYWSVNIKKGILSIFQVTLKEKTTITDPVYYDSTMSILKQTGTGNVPFWKLPRKSNTVYKVVETDITGICETKYSVINDKQPGLTAGSISTMQVTAVRDFDSCTTEPFHVKGLFQGSYVYPEEENILHPMVHTDYVITGDRTHFLIKEATLRGKYSFMLHGLEGGDMTTFILQKLTLKTTEPIRTPLRMSSPKICTLGLMMVIPDSLTEKKTFEDLPRSKWLPSREFTSGRNYDISGRNYDISGRNYETMEEFETFGEETGDVLVAVESLLTELLNCLHPSVTDKPCSDYLYRLDRVIRRIPKEKLKPFVHRYIAGSRTETAGTEYRKSEILLDLLPTLSSPDSALVIIDLIREQHISKLRGSLMIKGMSLTVKPTPIVVKSLLELFKELGGKESGTRLGSMTLLRQSVLLSVGTITHRMINVMRSHGKPQPEILNFVEYISGELKRMLDDATTEPEKILVLKSLGNMGAVQSIMILKNYIEDPRIPITIRTQSVYALRRLSKQFGKQVIPILMSIYMDTKEVRELRQAAFLVVMKSKPGFATLEMIAHKLRHEPSSQIRSLVYTTLVSFAEHTSHVPEHKELKHNARLVLKNLKPVPVGFHDSVSMTLNAFSEKYDLGAALNVLKIKSKMSGLPEALIANLQGMFLGKHRSIVEIGAEGKGLEVLLRKIFGPHGILKDILKGKVSLSDFIKPLTRPNMGEIEYKIKEILQRMMIETRSETQPFGSWYIHVLRNEIQYVLFNTENVEDLVNKVTTIVPELLMKLKRGINVDVIKSVSHITSLQVASPIGIPISLNYSISGILQLHGLVKVNNLPAWSEVINRQPLSKISLDVDLKPHLDATSYLALGVNMRWLSTLIGVEKHIRSKVPIKFATLVDPLKHTVSFKYFTPKETSLPLHARVIPATIIKYYPITPQKLPYIVERKEMHNEDIVKVMPFQHTYRCGVTGMTFETQGRVSTCGPTWCPFMPLFGKQEIMIKAHPTTPVEYINFEIKSLKSNFEFEGVPASYRTEHQFYEDYENDMMPLDGTHSGGRPQLVGDFEPVVMDPIFTSEPIKRQILVVLTSSMQRTPKMQGLFTWLMGRTYWKNQIDVQLISPQYENPSWTVGSSPQFENPSWKVGSSSQYENPSWKVGSSPQYENQEWKVGSSPQYENPAWKLHWNAVFNPLAWYSEPEAIYEPRSVEFLGKAFLKWNIMGEKQEVKVKVIPGSPIDFSRELQEQDILTAFTLPEARVQKYKYTVEAEFTHMGRKTLKYITLSHDLLRYLLANSVPHLTTAIPVNPQSNKVIVAVEVLPLWEQMNFVVKTPIRDSYFTKVPFYWNPLFPTREKLMLHDSPAWSWYNNTEYEPMYENDYDMDESSVESFPYRNSPIVGGECSIDGNSLSVFTFDGVSRTLPLRKYSKKGCEVVLVQDCSNYGLFSVVTTGLGTSGNWKVKYLIPNYEIELIKPRSGPALVRINGEERMMHKSQPIVIREDSTSSEVIKVEKFDEGSVEVKLQELGIRFIVDVENSLIKVKLSPFSTLQGQLCGVCGNYNLDQSDEYSVPEYMKIPSTRKYYESNIVPSETCDIERISGLEDEEDETCIRESHVTVNRYEDEIPMTCRSERKIKQCAPGCRPEKLESIKTCFRCTTEGGISRMTPYKPSRWDNMEGGVECEDFFTRVEVPTRCIPVY